MFSSLVKWSRDSTYKWPSHLLKGPSMAIHVRGSKALCVAVLLAEHAVVGRVIDRGFHSLAQASAESLCTAAFLIKWDTQYHIKNSIS